MDDGKWGLFLDWMTGAVDLPLPNGEGITSLSLLELCGWCSLKPRNVSNNVDVGPFFHRISRVITVIFHSMLIVQYMPLIQ